MSIALSPKKANLEKKGAKHQCAHCGDPVSAGTDIYIEDLAFCCSGCKTVYEILNTNGLSQYYKIEKQPGISWKKQQSKKYDWLNNEAIVDKLLDFQDEEKAKISFHLPQIHCASCVWLLENLHRLHPGVVQVRVNFLKKEASIDFYKKDLSLQALVELLAKIGYSPELNAEMLEDKPKARVVDRRFYYQLGLAGFAFGNIMLLSFPEYLGLREFNFQKFFAYLNLLLAIPVVFYSAQSYLKSAYYVLRQRQLNIDVPLALGILTLFGRSIFEILSQTGPGYLDSLAGLVFFLLIGKWFQQKTYYKLSFERDYKSYFPVAVTVKQDGRELSKTIDQLAPGDIIYVRNKEIIPADGVLMDGKANIDYSFVTGEAETIEKKSGDKLYAGGRQQGKAISIQLTKAVAQSYLTQLWSEQAFQSDKIANTQKIADKAGKWFTWLILSIAGITLLYWLPKDINIAINAFTAVLIIACPCAVALSIPFTFGNVLWILAKRNFYLKSLDFIEVMSKANAVVFDKTGTLTSSQEDHLDYVGKALNEAQQSAVRSLANQSSHPISRALVHNFKNRALLEPESFKEITGQGIYGVANGFTMAIEKSEKATALSIDGEYFGKFLSKNTYRQGIQKLIKNLDQDYDLYLLSGDNDKERAFLQAYFQPDHLHFDQSPKEKLAFIKSLQDQNKKVIMIGDGLNDAGALQQSDFGVVVTENKNNFTPACDAILEANELIQLPKFLQFSKGSVKLIYYAFALAFVYNVIGLSFAVQGLLSPVIAAILMPLSSVTIIAFGVGFSSLMFRKQ